MEAAEITVDSLPSREVVLTIDTTFDLKDSHQQTCKGMVGLSNLVRSTNSFTPEDFEKQMSNFGDALKGYDSQAFGQNTTFALLDRLIQRAGGSRNSSLTLTATVNGATTTKMLIA